MSLPDWAQPVIDKLGAGDGRWEPGGKLRFRCPFPGRHRGGDQHPSAWLKLGDNGQLLWGCACGIKGRRTDIEAAGLRVSDFYPPEKRPEVESRKSHPPRLWVAEYVYTDPAGEVVAVKDKFSPGAFGKAKSFEWRRPIPADPGAWAVGPGVLDGGRFTFAGFDRGGRAFRRTEKAEGMAHELPKVVPPLYGLQALATAAEGRSVWCVEGEKDCETLAACGVVAVCSPFASNDLPRDHLGHFAGRVVVACGDNDAPGRTYLDHVTAAAVRHRAAAVVLVDWETVNDPPPEGGDITDWLRVQTGWPDPARCRAALWELRRWATTYTLTTGQKR